MADEYFRETAINGGSILSLVSAQPILRKGGYCVFLFAGTSTLVHYTRKQKKKKTEGAAGEGFSCVLHDTSSPHSQY